MTKEEYEQTNMYREGCMYIEFGKLLCSGETNLADLADFGYRYGHMPSVTFFVDPKVQDE